jgi:hypothetical protein
LREAREEMHPGDAFRKGRAARRELNAREMRFF